MLLISDISVQLLVILVIVFQISFAHTKEDVNVITSSNYNTKTLPDRTICGLQKLGDRVLGGSQTEIGEFPWMVALEYKHKETGQLAGIKCGGSLINNRYVLTAAHCIKHREFKLTNVRLGEWNIAADADCLETEIDCADPVQRIDIVKEIPHRYYSKSSGDNDIGLLKLERDIQFTEYIRPICLPTINLPFPKFGTKLTVAGWGATENGLASDILLKVEVPLLENANCSRKLLREIDGNQLCAGGEPGKDTCQGDSGGPLMRLYGDTVNQHLQWYQEGAVAFGEGCGRRRYPAIYTRISRFIKWIMNNISKN